MESFVLFALIHVFDFEGQQCAYSGCSGIFGMNACNVRAAVTQSQQSVVNFYWIYCH
jgi:hypothetical protein